MKKPIIALAALIVAAGASVGALWAVNNKKKGEEKASSEMIADNSLFSFDSKAVTKIVFRSSESDEYVAECDSEGKNWVLTNRDDFALDQNYISCITSYGSSLTAVTSYGKADSEETKAMYGLDNPDSVTLYVGDTPYTVYIGNMSPTGELYYVMIEGRDNIYAVEAMYASVFQTSRSLLKNKDLVSYDLYSIKEISVIRDGKVSFDLTYEPDSQTWSLPPEYSKLTFDQTAVTAMINVMIRLEAEDMLDENLQDLSKYGFDNPEAEVIVKGFDGKEQKFLVAPFEDNPNYSYVLKENDNQVELYFTGDLDFIENTSYDFILQNVPSADIYYISGFELTFGENTDVCKLNMKESTCEINGKQVDFDNGSVYTAFQNYFNSFNNLQLSGVDVDAKPEFENPVLTAVYHFDGAEDVQIDLVSDDNGGYYVFRNKSYTGEIAGNELAESRTSLTEFRNVFNDLAGLE